MPVLPGRCFGWEQPGEGDDSDDRECPEPGPGDDEADRGVIAADTRVLIGPWHVTSTTTPEPLTSCRDEVN